MNNGRSRSRSRSRSKPRTKLDTSLRSSEDVGALDIAVDKVMRMHVLETLETLVHDERNLLLEKRVLGHYNPNDSDALADASLNRS